MPRNVLAFFFLSMPLLLLAQKSGDGPRANHYLDHVVLGISDVEKGMDEVQRRTGIRPRIDGRNPQLGTQSAVIGLGDKTFLEILAPDPKANPADVDPELKSMILDRLMAFDDLTPFGWAIGTGNLERTLWIARRAGSHVSGTFAGSRKRGWGRSVDWTWARVDRPVSRVTPHFVQWGADTKPPQQRAPQGCTLTHLQINTRNFKPIQALLAAMQIEADAEGAEEDSLAFALDCDGEEVEFGAVELTAQPKSPSRAQRE